MDGKGIINILNGNKDSVGTGFYVSPNGYILTCYHVLEEIHSITIGSQVAFRFVASERIHLSSLRAIDISKDVAILQTDVVSATYYVFQVRGRSGDQLSTLGFPNGDRIGIPASPVLQDYIENEKYIQLKDANTITYGFSGAPLVTEAGFAVGMVAWIPKDCNSRMENIAHAIPASLIIEAFPNYVETVEETENMEDFLTKEAECYQKLPHVLTKSGVIYGDEQSVIHREIELKEIEHFLTKGKKALLLSGFGGIGKTSLARVMYSRVSNYYGSIGWVEYRGNLKMSLLASIELYEDVKDQEKRWEILSKCLKNDLSPKLLFIDNVDRDAIQGQDPLKDGALLAISGWPNITVVLTSRLDEIQGYQSYKIGYLGDNMHRKSWCEDLFYFYYNKEEYDKPIQERRQTEAVHALVELAGYHTYAIELLAKSAKYEPSLEHFFNAVRKSGFQFPSLNIRTNHRDAYANAAEQLRKLFDMKTRTDLEKRILWDFAILPNICLTADEVNNWLGYTINDLDQLIAESWLSFQEGFFMHPLIKEVILLNLEEGKAPLGTASKLIEYLYDNRSNHFISSKEAYTTTIRKLDIAENIIKYVPIQKGLDSAKIYFNVGYCFFSIARRRISAISYCEKALQLFQQLEVTQPGNYTEDIAEVSYQLGYIESATNGYRIKSVTPLQKALNIRRMQEAENPGMYIAEVAKVCDHLGYVLSGIENRHEEAAKLLVEALKIRRKLAAENPSVYEVDVATTCDNLGCLLSVDCSHKEESEELLKEALVIRRKLADISPGRHLTEVAWTCHNLGDLLAMDSNRRAEAEQFYCEALKIRKRLECEKPGVYTGNVAWTSASLAKLLFTEKNRTTEVVALCHQVIEMRQKLDSDHLGFFIDDIAKECQSLLDMIPDDN